MAAWHANLRQLTAAHPYSAAFWAIFLTITICLGIFKVWQNASDASAQQAWRMRLQELEKLRAEEVDRLNKRARELVGKPGSRRQLEIEWNQGAPFDLKPLEVHPKDTLMAYGRETATWFDPKFNSQFSLLFRQDMLQGISVRGGTGLQTMHPRPLQFSRRGSAESWRAAIATLSGYAWLIVFLLVWFLPQRRQALVHALAACALAFAMATAVNPFYSQTLNGITSNDRLAFAAFMILVTANLAIAMWVASRPEAKSLFPVRFGLRSLLIVMTIAACGLSLGEPGYLLLGVIVVGWAFYVLMYESARRRPLV